MCSFNIIKRIKNSLEKINYHTKKRGPDHTNIKEINNITFIHNLLHITGKKTEQPFMKDNIVCVFNGEIYNYKEFGNYESDGECLIDLYKKYDIDFIKKLDGEFAIALIDFSKKKILMSTDIFATKPIFYSFYKGNIMISSYEKSIELNKMKGIKKLEPNKTEIYDLNTLKRLEIKTIYNFDLKQYKDNYDDWNKAFEKAIMKRTNNLQRKLFISLSSGYDSGAICCALNNLGIKYNSYTVNGKEDKEILEQRYKINKNNSKSYDLNEEIINNYVKKNEKDCCNYIRKVREDSNKDPYEVLKDRASAGGSFICDKAREEGCIISLSGQGADEIYSDYGFNGKKYTWHSCFGGKYPEDLATIFPWESFYGGIGQCLIMKEEIIGGSHGIEQRYPFLDKEVVQEFLWLKHDLKNKYYKAPIHNYLKKNNYPFKENKKVGFNVLY